MPAPSTPDWLVGYLNWRGLDLPVISYDAANGGHLAVPGDNRGRVVVLNTIGEHHHDMPFMALVTQGIPSQARLTEADIRQREDENGPADPDAGSGPGRTRLDSKPGISGGTGPAGAPLTAGSPGSGGPA